MPKWGTLHLKMLSFFCFSSFVFKENDVLNEEYDPSKKFFIVDKEQEDIDIDDTGDSEDLSGLGSPDEECGNLQRVDKWWRAN